MTLYPLDECLLGAHDYMNCGATVHQQYLCSHCGSKQTMDVPNLFHKYGRCEECDHVTNIAAIGCNYTVILPARAQN